MTHGPAHPRPADGEDSLEQMRQQLEQLRVEVMRQREQVDRQAQTVEMLISQLKRLSAP